MKIKKYGFIILLVISLLFIFRDKFKVKINKSTNLQESLFYNNYIKNDTLVVINQWASWCKPCIVEIPYLNSLKKKYGNKIKFISFSKDKDTSTTIESMKKHHFLWEEYTLIDNSNKEVVDDFLNKKSVINIDVLPKTFLVKKGEILETIEGQIEDTTSFDKLIYDNM